MRAKRSRVIGPGYATKLGYKGPNFVEWMQRNRIRSLPQVKTKFVSKKKSPPSQPARSEANIPKPKTLEPARSVKRPSVVKTASKREEDPWEKFLKPGAKLPQRQGESADEVLAVAPKLTCEWVIPETSEAMRVVPNAIVRSALFGIVHRGQRRYINGESIMAWRDTRVRFKGEQLDQRDLDVWLQVIHLIRQQPLHQSTCHFTARSFMKALGRTAGGDGVKVLFGSLERMVACALTIERDGSSYTGSLIQSFAFDKQSGLYAACLNPELCQLFDSSHTRLHWETRQALPMGLSRWLHNYVLSHKTSSGKPHRIGIQALCDLTGSSSAVLKKFREKLKQSMAHLEQASVVQKWGITKGDALEFVRP